jgi:MEMO1 family protein
MEIRRPVIAGSWYPGDPEILVREIRQYLKNVSEEPVDGAVIALISPHAGYVYSGQVAAYGYRLIEGKTFDSVIVIGPSHRSYFEGVSLFNTGGYETPLGVIPVDEVLAERILAGSRLISANFGVHTKEHSLEIQLPFLQVVLGKFKFVPVIMGDQDRRTCEALAEAIVRAVAGRSVLIVGSSDLSHFYEYERAVRLDSAVLDSIRKMDSRGFLDLIGNGKGEACGAGPAAVVMMAAARLGAGAAKVLKYANSGDVTGDRDRVVGYASVAIYRKKMGKTFRTKEGASVGLGLKKEEKACLLNIARASIQSRLEGGKIPEPSVEFGTLKENRGAFVSLKKRGRLRGCIGCIEARRPLYRTIEEMANAAAFNDPRFPPLRKEEIENLNIEISVLTPLKRINDVKEIEIGKHGLYIVKGFHSGLLLPQVATEYKWDRETFLEETCHKAGLSSDAWKDEDTGIFIFSADVFGSDE